MADSAAGGFDGETVIVTGSTRGIGEGIAKRFAREAASVVVSGRTVEDGERVVDDIAADGGEATFIEADMGDRDAIENLVAETVAAYDDIHCVVNNAAAWNHGPFLEREMDTWDMVMDVSLRAPWLLVKESLEHMPAGSSVINISSIHGLRTDPEFFPYNVAKAGLNGMTRQLALDLGPLGITVNGVLPGKIEAPEDIPEDDDSRYAHYAPVGRQGTPSDVAGITAFLASDDARFITGENVTVDGGWTACLLVDDFRYPADRP